MKDARKFMSGGDRFFPAAADGLNLKQQSFFPSGFIRRTTVFYVAS